MKRRHVLLGAAVLAVGTGTTLAVQRGEGQPLAEGAGTPGAPANATAGASGTTSPPARPARRSNIRPVGLRAVTFNIRGSTWEEDPEDLWNRGRNARATRFLRAARLDVVGFQEFEAEQQRDLFGDNGEQGSLGPDFDHVDAPIPGARNTIAYRRERFELVTSGFRGLPLGWPTTLALTDTFARGLTWVMLRDRDSGQQFIVFNTHLEHRGRAKSLTGETYSEIRRHQAEAVARFVTEVNPQALPMLMLGDLNSDELGGAYGAIVTGTDLVDAQLSAATVVNSGISTYNAFSGPQVGKRIDFVFVNSEIQVEQYWVDTAEVDGRLPSDHFPTIVDVTLG
ncbi:endonuclease/exonuclease/phosphatase family protein [Micrococcales bacterium 31B]|nr:endonuclease/exonuclease/phosphatase family protein [Micrococcales bacterium 31B]